MVKIADYGAFDNIFLLIIIIINLLFVCLGLRSLHSQIVREQDVNPRALFWTAPGK